MIGARLIEFYIKDCHPCAWLLRNSFLKARAFVQNNLLFVKQTPLESAMEIGQAPAASSERRSDAVEVELPDDDAQSINEVALGDK